MNVCIRSARRPLRTLLNPITPAASRWYSAAVSPGGDTPTTEELIEDPTLRSDLAVSSPYAIHASVVISRPPMLTPILHPFEESFYFYQRRLNQRLALPFTRYFYFKKGTPADLEWKRKQKEHADPYTGFGKEGWKDELLVGDDKYKEAGTYEKLVKTTVTGEEGLEEEAGIMDRETEADRKKDRRSLDRAGEKTLYLLVKKNKGRWSFPEAKLVGKENLKQAAIRTLEEAAGINMNTWFVGNVPIGHYVEKYKPGHTDGENVGKKVFFMKARIMAGQADLKNNKLGLEDFLWLSKAEIDRVAGRHYYKAVEHMLVSG